MPRLAVPVALGTGAIAGIGLPGGTMIELEPPEPEDEAPDPAEQAIGPMSERATCGLPTRRTSCVTGS